MILSARDSGPWVALLLSVGVAAASVAIGATMATGVGPLLLASFVGLAVAGVAVRTRWAAAFVLAPTVLVPVTALARTTIGPLAPSVWVVVVGFGTLGLIALTTRSKLATPALGAVGVVVLVAGATYGAIAAGTPFQSTVLIGAAWCVAYLAGLWLTPDLKSVAAVLAMFAVAAALAYFEVAVGRNPYAVSIGPLVFSPEQAAGFTRASGTFGAPIVAGAAFAMAAVLAWSVGQRSYGLLGLFLAGASVLTVSRSGIFGLLVGAAVLVLAQRGQRLRVLVLVLGAAAISVTAFSNLSLFRETVDNRIFQSSYQQDTRENTLKIVAGDFNDRPLSLLIGQGLRSKQRELAAQGGNAGFSTLDNQFATFLYDVGVVPFLLGSGLIVVGIRRALPERRRIFLPPLMAGLAIFAFFDGLYWSGTAALFFFLLGGASSTSRFGRGHV